MFLLEGMNAQIGADVTPSTGGHVLDKQALAGNCSSAFLQAASLWIPSLWLPSTAPLKLGPTLAVPLCVSTTWRCPSAVLVTTLRPGSSTTSTTPPRHRSRPHLFTVHLDVARHRSVTRRRIPFDKQAFQSPTTRHLSGEIFSSSLSPRVGKSTLTNTLSACSCAVRERPFLRGRSCVTSAPTARGSKPYHCDRENGTSPSRFAHGRRPSGPMHLSSSRLTPNLPSPSTSITPQQRAS